MNHKTSRMPMRQKPMRTAVCRALTALALGAGYGGFAALALAPASAAAQTVAAQAFDIPAGPLEKALARFGEQTGLMIAYDAAQVQGKNSPGVSGQMPPEQALGRLLTRTGLQFVRQDNGGYILRASPDTGRDVAQLSDVVVTAERDSTSEGTGLYAARAVTIGKTTQTLREIPQSVTVMTRQRLDDQNLYSVQDVMDQAPGVVVEIGDNYEGSFYARGFAISNIQIDGTSFGSEGRFADDMILYDRVEVLRGADGLFNGTGEPGGSINLTRKRPTHEFQAEVGLTAGRWNNYRADADISSPLAFDGKLRGRLIASYEDRDFFYDVADRKRSLFYGIIEADLTPSTTVAIGGSYTHSRDTPWWFYSGLPRYSTGEDIGLPTSTGYIADWSWWKAETREVFARINQKIGQRWQLNLSGTHIDNERESLYSSVSGPVDPILKQGTFRAGKRDWSSKVKSFDANLQGAFDAFGLEHKVVVGADWKRVLGGEINFRTVFPAGYTPPPVDIFNFDPGGYPEPIGFTPFRGWPSYGNTQKSLYGRLQLKLAEPLTVVVGARYASYDYTSPYVTFDANGNTASSSDTGYKESGILTPYLGVVYDINRQLTAYASATRIHISQGDKLAGPMPGTVLDPIEGTNFEAGLKGSFLNDRLNASIALYQINRRNQAVQDGSYPGNTDDMGVSCCWLAQGDIRSQGVELEVNGEILPGWQVFAGYTYNSSKNRGTQSEYATFTPRHLFKLWTTYRFQGDLRRWKVGGGVVAQSRSYKSGTALPSDINGQAIPGASAVPYSYAQGGYAVWPARADYDITSNWSAALQISNLFNRRYYKTLGSSANYNWYGEPRNVMLTLRGRF